jgi:cbb3-type cytochrome oxidase subunit 3
MNTAFRAAAENAQLGWIMGVMTALFLVCFVGWTWWAFARRNKAYMDEAGRMPLSDGDDR